MDLGNSVVGRVWVLRGKEILVIGESGGVVKEIADGDAVSVRGEVGEDRGESGVIVQLAVVDEKHDAGGSELLGEGCEAEVGLCGDRCLSAEVRNAVRPMEDWFATANNFEGKTRGVL
jgi:hypothetical protein